MGSEKQIEELSKYICNACEMGDGFDGECAGSGDYKTCFISSETAKHIYEAGYRKQSEVAREIFDAIKEKLIFNTYGIATISDKTFCELKKKYTEEQK